MPMACGRSLPGQSDGGRSLVGSEERPAENAHLLAGDNDIRTVAKLIQRCS